MATETFSLIEPALAAAAIRLDARARDRLERFAALLAHWNRRMNLVGDVERLYSRHLLDCLLLERLPWPPGPLEVLDVGAGAGLPGIVLAVLHPAARVVAVETVAKKVTFQRVAAQALALENYLPRRADARRLAEDPGERGRYGVVVARAFAGLAALLELAAPLLRPGGELWAMKGERLPEEQAAVPAELRRAYEPEPALHPYAFPELGVGGVVAVYRRRAGEAGGRLEYPDG